MTYPRHQLQDIKHKQVHIIDLANTIFVQHLYSVIVAGPYLEL